MQKTFLVSMVNQTVVADETVICVRTAAATATAASRLLLIRASVSQQGTTTSQQLGVIVATKASAFGTFTAATPVNLTPGGAASGLTGSTSVAAASAGTDASAEGAGTVTDIFSEGFNNLAGWLWVPTPEERIEIPVDTAFIIKLRGTPTTLTGWNAHLVYREID